MKTVVKNDQDHYDNCYGDDDDKYEEHLGSIGSLGRGGGVLLHVNYLTPCDLYRVETPGAPHRPHRPTAWAQSIH